MAAIGSGQHHARGKEEMSLCLGHSHRFRSQRPACFYRQPVMAEEDGERRDISGLGHLAQ